MKYCLDCHQPDEYLQKVDQIRIKGENWEDILYTLLDKYPDKEFILEINEFQSLDKWREIAAASQAHNNNIIICAKNQNILIDAHLMDLKAYYGYPITSYYELNAVRDLDVCYVLIDAPLFFDLDQVRTYNIPIRVYPNVAYENYLAHTNGIHGSWIRPEDIEYYEDYIDVFDFYFFNNEYGKERTLYDIYTDGYWNDDLSLLITNLDFKCRNDLISQQSIMPTRLNCQQKCERKHHCHICENALQFETVIKKDIMNIENRMNKLIDKYN